MPTLQEALADLIDASPDVYGLVPVDAEEASAVTSEPQQGPPETMEDRAVRLVHRVAEQTAEVERLRAMVVALEQECAALADELDADRHEFTPDREGSAWCTCHYRADSRWHRTAAWVRKLYGFGAT